MTRLPDHRTRPGYRCGVSLGLIAALAASVPALAAEPGFDPAKLEAVSERLNGFIEEGQIVGAVTAVARPGRAVTQAVGFADREAKRQMTADTLFAVASMTKPVAATAVMILVDEGKLSLDDPVSKYVPEFKDAALKAGGRPGREVTLRDVMTHTSGLGGDQKLEGSIEETAKKLAARPLDFEPGTKWQYSPGLTVAARCVEVASGRRFEEFLAERIFAPLDMTDTTFYPSPEQLERLAQLYEPAEGGGLKPAKHWIHDAAEPGRGPNPSGGLFSTAGDMARFYLMVLNGGELDGRRVVSKESVAEMTKLQTGDLATGFTPGNGWGLGWCVVREPQGVSAPLSPGSFGHGGALGTQGWVDPGTKAVYVLMIQRWKLPNSDASDIRRDFQRLASEAMRD